MKNRSRLFGYVRPVSKTPTWVVWLHSFFARSSQFKLLDICAESDRQARRQLRIEYLEYRLVLTGPTLELTLIDDTAHEPHLVYCQPSSSAFLTTARFSVNGNFWPGGSITVHIEGTAKFGHLPVPVNPPPYLARDYMLQIHSGLVTQVDRSYLGPGDSAVTVTLNASTEPFGVEFELIPLLDGAEPGQLDADNEMESATETAVFTINPSAAYNISGGSAAIEVVDHAESLVPELVVAEIKEFGPPPGYIEFKPGDVTVEGTTTTLCVGSLEVEEPIYIGDFAKSPYYFEVDISPENSANVLGFPNGTEDAALDYELIHTQGAPEPNTGWYETAPDILESAYYRVADVLKLQALIEPLLDHHLEGEEVVKLRLIVPDLDYESPWQTITIKEEYYDAKAQKDEIIGSTACFLVECIDGQAISISPWDGSTRVALADGFVVVVTDNQEGLKPSIHVGLTLPEDKAIPESISAQIRVIEKRTDEAGNLVRLGRKLVDQSPFVSPLVQFVIPETFMAGETYWFHIEADLTDHVESWTFGSSEPGLPSLGASGINEKLIHIEVLISPTFATTVPAVETDELFSGWVGRVNHVLRNSLAGSLHPEFGGNLQVPGLDRMIRDSEQRPVQIAIPDGSPEEPSGGKVQWQSGSILVRADGGVSWYQESAGGSPDSLDILSDGIITDRYDNKRKFNADGLMTEYEDAAGNSTSYAYMASGALSAITNSLGQQTLFTAGSAGAGTYTIEIRTVNSGGNSDRVRMLKWNTNGRSLTIDYDDPDEEGTGRRARRDVLKFDSIGHLYRMESGRKPLTPEELAIPDRITTISATGRVTVSYANGSSTILELARRDNWLLSSSGNYGSPVTSEALGFLIKGTGPDQDISPIPAIAAITHLPGNQSTARRTILQLDHRGRVTHRWDPEQVNAMELDGEWQFVQMSSQTYTDVITTLQANIERSYQYSLEETQRDEFGRIIDHDYGELLELTTPKMHASGQRQTTTWTYQNDNPITQQQPIQNQETFEWFDEFDILSRAVDPTGNSYFQQVDNYGRITQQRWEGIYGPLPPGTPAILAQIDYQYVAVPSLPNTLISKATVRTDRASGDRVTDYEYYVSPSTPALHGKLWKITEVGEINSAITQFTYDDRGNVATITDSAGRVTEYWYDRRDRLVARLSPVPGNGLLPVLERYDYDLWDNVIATEVINSYMEGDQNPLLRVTIARTTHEYDKADRLIKTTVQSSANRYLMADSGGGNGFFSETPLVPSVSSTVTAGLLASYAQDNPQFEVPGSAGLTQIHSYFSEPDAIVVTQTDPGNGGFGTGQSRTTTFLLDRLDRVVEATTPAPNHSTDSVSTVFSYDWLGNLTSVDDALSNSTSMSYDLLNRITLLSQPSPSGSGPTTNTQFEYVATSIGWKIKTTNPLGQEVSTQLDSVGRVVEVTGDTPNHSIAYWTDGVLKSVTDELGRTTDYDYDRRSRLISIAAPAPSVGVARSTYGYLYSIDSLLTKTVDPMLRETTYSYNAGGQLTQVTQPDPDGAGSLEPAYQLWTRDSLGNVMSSSNALDHTTFVTRDGWFRSKSTVDPDLGQTQFEYDGFGNVTELTDAKGNVTEFSYNRLDQLIEETQVGPSGNLYGSRTYARDAVGNVVSATDRNGRTIEYVYDDLYRPTTETWKTGATTNRTISYSHDAIGNLTALTDSNVLSPNFSFVYDDRNQLQIERQRRIELGFTTYVNLDHDYNQVGKRTQLQLNFHGTISGQSLSGGVNDLKNTYQFDGMDRMTEVTQAASGLANSNTVATKRATFAYFADSQLASIGRYANTGGLGSSIVSSTFEYDMAGRTKEITHYREPIEIEFGGGLESGSSFGGPINQAGLIAQYKLTYDRANRLTNLWSWRDRIETGYTYDTRSQLTAATSTAIAGLGTPAFMPADEDYGYDATGNRLGEEDQSQSAAGTHNRLQTDGQYNYEYDNEGNVTLRTELVEGLPTGPVREFSWDHRNRLTKIVDRQSSGGTIVQQVRYDYDAFDRLVVRQELDGYGLATRRESRIWDGDQLLMQVVDADGFQAQQARVTNRYLYGPIVDMLMADEQNRAGDGYVPAGGTTASGNAGQTLWALSDHLGSVRDLVDNASKVRKHILYDSFGNRVFEQSFDSTGTLIGNTDPAAVDALFGYTGREWDSDVDLQYNRARWYDPVTGRWLSQDPIGFEAGDANLYRYVGNGSTNATDPSGLAPPRTPQGVPRAGGGHHPLPYEHWWNLNLSVDVQKIFNKVVPHQFPGGGSNSAAHMAYNARVGALMREWVERNGGPHNITPQMAAEFLESILNSSDPIIRGFLDRVNGPKDRMTRWFHEEATPYLEEEARQLGALNKAGRTSKWRMVGTVMTKTGKVFKVLAIGSTVMYLSQGGVLYAMEQSTKDFFFVDELSPHLVYAGEIVDGEYTYLKARVLRNRMSQLPPDLQEEHMKPYILDKHPAIGKILYPECR